MTNPKELETLLLKLEEFKSFLNILEGKELSKTDGFPNNPAHLLSAASLSLDSSFRTLLVYWELKQGQNKLSQIVSNLSN